MEKTPQSPHPDAPRPSEQSPSMDSSQLDDSVKTGAANGNDVEEKGISKQASAQAGEQESQDDTSDDKEEGLDDSIRHGEEKPESSLRGEGLNLDMILDIPLEITVELGRTQMPINELLQLGPGSAVPLSKLEGEPVDILANDRLIAKGIVLVKDEKYGIQITEITGRLERLRGLR